ncbi:MAG: hypothetical protein IJX72_01135 [Clostridia bacterium]|nr:hypothetical protein [Clostridia bacterium]
MKEPNTTLAYALGHIDAAYIADAELPELTAAAACPCRARHRRERDVPRFWESGWFAAAISAVVAVGVLTFIVMMGQRDPLPPVGTDVPPPVVTETEPANTEAETDSPHTIPEGYTVTDTLYPYGDETVILLRVKNQTAENVTLSVRMVYRDQNGKTVAQTSQSVLGFSAEHEKYLMFRTKEMVTSYTYEVRTKPYKGEYLDHLYSSEFSHIEETSMPIFPGEDGYDSGEFETDGTYYPCLAVYMTGAYTGNVPVDVARTYVLFDNQGRIYRIETMGTKYLDDPRDFGSIAMVLQYTTEDTVQWPPELMGEGVTCIEIYSVGPPDPSFSYP